MTLPDCMMPDGAEPCKAFQELQSRLSACEKLLAEVRFDRDAERARVIAAEGRLRTLQTTLQRIVDGRFLGYVEAQEIARGALDGDIAVETCGHQNVERRGDGARWCMDCKTDLGRARVVETQETK